LPGGETTQHPESAKEKNAALQKESIPSSKCWTLNIVMTLGVSHELPETTTNYYRLDDNIAVILHGNGAEFNNH
jgi:hypothetical protein